MRAWVRAARMSGRIPQSLLWSIVLLMVEQSHEEGHGLTSGEDQSPFVAVFGRLSKFAMIIVGIAGDHAAHVIGSLGQVVA